MTEKQLFLDPRETALIVVDMQNDFCHPKGFYAGAKSQLVAIGLQPELIGKVTPRIKELLAAARKAGAYVVHTQIIRDPDLHGVERLHRIVPKTYAAYKDAPGGPPLVPGSWGVDTIEELKPEKGEYVLQKRGFSTFYQTDLEMMLRRRNIKTVIIAGTVTYACVLHTAFDAYSMDFDVVVVEDAVSSWAPELQRPALRIVDLLIGAVLPTKEVVATLKASR